jgi:hypothetical protein
MSARSTNFCFLPHVNTPLADFCALVLPFIYSEGGRMRWGAMVMGPLLYVSFGMSASLWLHMGDLVNSSLLGMAAAVGYGTVTQTGFFPVGRFVPKRVSAGIGAAYFCYHAYWYRRAVTYAFRENIDDE